MFGMTVFESVLERLRAEAREAEEEIAEEQGPGPVRGLTSGFAGLGATGAFMSGSQAAAAYLDLYEEPAPPEPEPESPPEEPAPYRNISCASRRRRSRKTSPLPAARASTTSPRAAAASRAKTTPTAPRPSFAPMRRSA